MHINVEQTVRVDWSSILRRSVPFPCICAESASLPLHSFSEIYVVLSSANFVVFSTDVSQNNINLKYLERNE